MSSPQLPVQPDCRDNAPYEYALGIFVAPRDDSDFNRECHGRKL
jgi:hypothetical protein